MKRRDLMTAMALAATPAAASDASFATTWRNSFVAHWKDTKEYSLAVVDAMPADGYTSRPTPVQMTFGEQVRHHAQANVAYFNTFGLVPLPANLAYTRADIEKNVPAADKEAVRKYVEAGFDYVLAVLDKMSDKDLSRTDLKLGRAPHSAIDVCLRAYTHTAHHRGQAVVYLRVKGIQPPTWKFEPHV
jgi:uncharacterized damage-inducible protein DinB